MKPLFDKHKWHTLVMILCFIYGGVSLVIFILQITTLVQAEKSGPHIEEMINLESQTNESLIEIPPSFKLPNSNFSRRGFFGETRTNLFYPVIIASLSGSVISILAGLSLMDLLRKKEKKELTKSVIDSMTTPEEKTVIKELEENNDELTQSELVKRTKLSKVKVHRIIKRLESLKVVSKYPYGITNKIKLEKKIYKE